MNSTEWLVAMLLIILLAFGIFVLLAAVAQAATTEDIMYQILAERGSPLADEAYTVVAFRRAQGCDFSIIDFYSILWAESNLGRDSSVARHKNVASIIGGKPGTLWRDLRTGVFGGRGYNEYTSFRDGQRAALRLVMARYGGSVLRNDGLLRWYGPGIAGWSGYQADVSAAKAILLREGREHGLNPVHLQ